MPDNLSDVTVQRVVVRNGLSRDLAGLFLADLEAEVTYLDSLTSPMPDPPRTSSFRH
jgi:glutamate decarboxylase